MALNETSSRYIVPHQRAKKYYNYHNEKFHGFFLNSIAMFCRSLYYRARSKKPIQQDWAIEYNHVSSLTPTITWIGHSTFLIELDGITILTDPIFGNASLLFKRIFPPGIPLEKLKSIDYILLSHNHRDHMDARSLLQLRHHNPQVMVPLGDKKWFDRRAFRLVQEKNWWESSTFMHNGNALKLTFLPAHHWSQRSVFDRNKSLWGSWMIEYKDYTIYFAGDTAYAAHFKKIKAAFSPIDIALMPIGPCEPRKWMKEAHISAEQAGEAFLELGAKQFIPMHWGTFYFGIDALHQPLEQLQTWWKEQKQVSKEQLQLLKIGQRWQIDKECIAKAISKNIETIL